MRRIVAIVLVIFMCVAFTSCYNENNPNHPIGDLGNSDTVYSNDMMDKGPVKGGIIRLFSTRPDSLNPILSKNIYVQDFSSLIFEGLFKLGKDQNVIPVLSDKWDVSSDGLIWNFHIRENVLWHDGSF